MIPFIQSGGLRALLVTTPERYPLVADVPTARELGYPQLERITGWSALYGPPGLDKEVIGKWAEALQKVAKDAAWIAQTEKIGSVPRILSPAATEAFAREQFETYDKLGRALGLRQE
jgi:tripartite-type tricarboxylate transporter receptor subunit TctC